QLRTQGFHFSATQITGIYQWRRKQANKYGEQRNYDSIASHKFFEEIENRHHQPFVDVLHKGINTLTKVNYVLKPDIIAFQDFIIIGPIIYTHRNSGLIFCRKRYFKICRRGSDHTGRVVTFGTMDISGTEI